jgi:hypothetical protein
MDVDIRKQSRYGKVEIHRPYQGTPGGSNTSSGSHSASASPRTIEAQPYNEPVSDDDGEEEVYTKMVGGLDEAKQVKLPDNVIARVNEARAFREDKLRREAEARAAAGENGNVMPAPSAAKRLSVAKNGNGPDSFHIDPLSGSRQHDASYSSMLDKVGLSKLFKTKAQREEEEARGEEVDPDSQPPEMIRFNAPLGKRIAVPVRIEPKVIFANEVRPASLVIGHVRLLTKPPSLPLRRPRPRLLPAHLPQVAQLCRHPRRHLDRSPQLCLGRRRRRHVLGLCLLDLRPRRGRLCRRHVPLPRHRPEKRTSSPGLSLSFELCADPVRPPAPLGPVPRRRRANRPRRDRHRRPAHELCPAVSRALIGRTPLLLLLYAWPLV